MNNKYLLLAIFSFFGAYSAQAAEDGNTWREPGRFGAMLAQTSDGSQGGLIRETDSYELNLTFDASTSPSAANHTNTNGATGDLGTTLRAGFRTAIGDFNYISYGLQVYRTFFAKDDGAKIESSNAFGPYIGFQRHFSGTHFMLTGWILPYYFEDIASNGGSGQTVRTVTHHFFQTGGIGFAYLF